MKKTYHSSEALVDRLCNTARSRDRVVTFLVGSALSRPDKVGGYGVPEVSGIVDLIRSEFKGTSAEAQFDESLEGAPVNRYQKAFEFLHGRRGQDTANRIVRTAVWQALDTNRLPPHLCKVLPYDATPDTCKDIEGEVNAWVLPRAMDLFGNLLVAQPNTFGRSVLTTNFDPLIEVSISKQRGRFYKTVFHDDGNLEQTDSDGIHVIHLHGYWQGYDTLHTPQQLGQPRPQLGKSLARVVESSTLVVIGYGGWDDMITQVLVELLSDSGSKPEILWAFHEDNSETIEASNEQLLTSLSPGIGRGRVSLYQGIDCFSVFYEINKKLNLSSSATSESKRGLYVDTVVKKNYSGDGGWQQTSIEEALSILPQTLPDSDSPLFIDHWVGRDQELNILKSSIQPVAFVTGLGGQGKSALAGRLLQQQAMEVGGRFEFWDWRDCREESDRLGTQILRLVERLSNGAINPSQIEVTDIKAVVGVLFRVLRDRKALLVFDNVDQYIDLETLKPVKGLDVLVSEAQARRHHSLFLFTCRPDVRVNESRAVRLPLVGLTRDEIKELIIARRLPEKDHHLAQELHQTTDGHPLWVNLILMQALRRRDGLRGALDLIRQGGATLPETTKTIWGMLNDQQRNVLRTMAELDRPEPRNTLLDLLPGKTVNRVNKALKVLHALHLVETRTQPESRELLLGLHPIIREFVRTTFSKKDREKYVSTILSFLDRKIVHFTPLLSQEPSYEILENWTRKADLLIRFRHFEEATSIIAEITFPLIGRGYSEEMIRLTKHLFRECNWAEACSSYKNFDTVFDQCLTQMIEFGDNDSEHFLRKYEDAIPGRSSQFILLCNLQCYADWYTGKYESAIRWGEKGDQLKERTSVDTGFSTRHRLALARRDAGLVAEAIESFLDGESLEVVVKSGEWIEGKVADFYGNIGRCLFLNGRLDDALVCYVKSAQLLERSHAYRARLNKGYIRYWIAELMVKQERFDLAAASYRAAMCMWEDSSPPLAGQAKDKLKALVTDHPELHTYLDKKGWKAEGEYKRWLDRQ